MNIWERIKKLTVEEVRMGDDMRFLRNEVVRYITRDAR